MKKIFVAILTIIGFSSCQEQELIPECQSVDKDIYASIEGLNCSKTSMDENNNVLWSEGDQIVAFMTTTIGVKYQIKEQYVGSSAGEFIEVADSDGTGDLVSGQEIDHNVVVYPYSDQVWCMKNDSGSPTNSYKINVVLPETQFYVENSFADDAFPMVAVSANNKLTFRNICGGVKLQFKGEDRIKSIKLEGLAEEPISGKSSVIAYADGSAPVIKMASSASNSVTLDCGDGVQLNPDISVTFIISLPPVEFKSGMKITVTDTDGLSRSLTNTSANTIKRSSLLTFPIITYTQEGVFEIPDGILTSYEIPAEGGTIEIPVATNQEYEVMIPDDAAEWITAVKTKALREETIVLSIAENTLAEDRSAEVLVVGADVEVLNMITVNQKSGVFLTDYIDEYGINCGSGIDINGVIWAPVNCGYHAQDFKYGKLYQWGRKYGQGYEGSLFISFAPVDYKDAKLPTVRNGAESVKIANDILHEDFFYTGTGDFGHEDWANPSSEGSLWNLGTESNPIKSEYDPCPDGWRVPTWNELYDLSENCSKWTIYNAQPGRWFSGINEYSEEAPKVFLPAAGWRGADAADRRGEVGNYWCSQSWHQLGRSLSFSDYNSNFYMVDTARATGKSVRCVKITPELPAPSVPEVSGVVDLSKSGTSNSYIVSAGGSYKLRPTKGNSASSVGTITSVEVVWKTFGTDDVPNVGDLITDLKYEDGYIHFVVPSQFAEGNVLIAAKNNNGVILWSWHIWLTDNPRSQKYSNNYKDVGIMMDRNLGATSATPGTSASLGLLYQWGRKDPFIGSSSISNSCIAKSTIQWPEPVLSDSYTGTIKYAIANPTVFIRSNPNNHDWYYSKDMNSDYTRWTESTSSKSIYDPCPVGWRVPDGGDEGIWADARGTSYWVFELPYYIVSRGFNFCGKFGDDDVIWYPTAGYYNSNGEMWDVGSYGYYWSASYSSNGCGYLFLSQNESVYPTMSGYPEDAYSVRCIKE